MKKFHFSLEKVLQYKDSLLEEEKNKLMEIRVRKNTVDMKIESNERELVQTDRERTEKAAGGMTVVEMQSYSYRIETGRRLIKELMLQQKKLEIEVERQLAVVIACTQEVSGLEKLREKQLEEYNKEADKEQQLIISEMISSKYIERQMAAQ